MIKSFCFLSHLTLAIFGGLFHGFAFDVNKAEETSFVAEIRGPSGNIVNDAEFVLSPQKRPFDRKSFNVSKDGKVKVPEDTYKEESYWLVKHPMWSNKVGAHLKMKDYHSAKPFKIKLSTGPGMNGIVVDEKGKAVVGAKISLSREVPAGNRRYRYYDFDISHSTHKGEFQFPALSKAKFWLEAELDNKKTIKPYIVQHPSSDNIVLKLEPVKKVNLMVFDKNENKVKDYYVSWYATDGKIKKFNLRKQTVKGNNFVKEYKAKILVPMKKYLHINITSAKHKKYTQSNIELKKDFDLRVHLESLSFVSGLVLDAKSQLPVKGVKIQLKRKNEKGGYKKYYKNTKTNSKGEYQFYVESPEEYYLSASAKEYLDTEEITFSVKESVKKLKTIDLEKGEMFRLRLLEKANDGSENKIIANHLFKVKVSKKHSASKELFYQTDADGILKVSGLDEGYALTISTDAYAEKTVPFRKSSAIKDIVFTQAGSIEIKVVDEQGEVVEGLGFNREYQYRSRVSSNASWYKAKFDKIKQVYTLKGLFPGKHRFQINSAKEWRIKKYYTVSIEAGKTTYKEIIVKKAPFIYVKLNEEATKTGKKVDVEFYEMINNGSRFKCSVSQNKEKGMYQVFLNKSGYGSFTVKMNGFVQSKKIQLRETSDENKVYTVRLDPGLKITGKVLNENEETVPNVRIQLDRLNRDYNDRYHTGESGTTNAEGEFEVLALKEGKYNLTATHNDYSESQMVAHLKQSKLGLEVRLSKGFAIKGRVLSENNEPLANINVALSKERSKKIFRQYTSGFNSKIKSNKDGTFVFKHLKKGKYKIDAQSTIYGMASKSGINLKEGEQVVNVELVIKEGKEISGKVVDEDGNPLADIDIGAYSAFGGGGENPRTKSKKDGTFRLYPLKTGSYSIYAQHNDYQMGNRYNQQMFLAGKKDVVLKLKKKQVIKGVVKTHDGKALDNYQIFYRSLSLRGKYDYNIRILEMGENNEFSFKPNQIFGAGLPGEAYKFIVKANGYNPGESKEYTVSESFSEFIVLELKPEKSIEVNVQNLAGDSISGASVRFNEIKDNMNDINVFYSNGRGNGFMTDKEGKVVLKGVNRGVYKFTLTKGGYAAASKQLEIDPDAGVPLTITLLKGAIVSGVTYAADGSVEAGNIVRLSPVSWHDHIGDIVVLQSTTDAEGKYEIKNIPPGVYRIFKYKGNSNGAVFLGLDQSKGEEIELQNEQTYHHDLRDEEPEHRAKIEGEIPEFEGQNFMAMLMKGGHAQMSSVLVVDRKFVMEKIPAGDYILMVSSTNGFNVLKKNISIKEGQHLKVKFEDPKTLINAKVVMENGEPVPFSQAVLFRKSKTSSNSIQEIFNQMESTASVQNGELKIKVNNSGDFHLVIGLDRRSKETGNLIIDVSVSKDEQKDIGILTLKQGIELTGRVLDENSVAIPQARFFANVGGFPMQDYTWMSDKDGEFKLEGYPSGASELTVSAAGYLPKKIKVTSSDLTINLEKALELEVSLSGVSVSSRAVVLCDENGKDISPSISNMYFNPMMLQRRTDNNGRLTFKNISEGTYRLRILPRNKSGVEALSDPVQVIKGTPASILISILD